MGSDGEPREEAQCLLVDAAHSHGASQQAEGSSGSHYSPGRRYPNAHSQDIDHSHTDHTSKLTNQSNRSANPYSEIHATTLAGHACAAPRHYQVPVAPNDDAELNQLIETRRKRTLMLLRAKEAPKASVELTSPDGPDAPDLAPAPEPGRPGSGSGARSPTSASHYENLSLAQREAAEAHEQQVAAPASKPEELQVAGSTQPEADLVTSPSESQNCNTLSLVSDVLGDLSQEDNSLVQQLGPS